MNMFRSLILFFAVLITLTATAAAVSDAMQLTIADTSRKQGQFFSVTVAAVPSEPELWFMERKYTMFRQQDSSWRALVPVENMTQPGSYTLQIRAGKEENKIPVTVASNGRKIQFIKLDPSKQELKATGTEKSRVKNALQTGSPEKLHTSPFLRPAPGRTTSLFGLKRSYNGGPVESYHKGIDISAPQGTPVKSTAKGKVVLTGTVKEGFQVHGNTVIIDHGQGLTSIYMHLSAITVRDGESVEAGEMIGRVGHTGISTAPHLHWGTYLYGTSVDPELFEGNAF